MNRAAFFSSDNSQKPILIVDKAGRLGESLAREIKNETLVVYVSQKVPEGLENVVHIPFDKKIPTIPDNHYSHIFLIDENFELTKHVLDVFIKKAQSDNSYLVLCVNSNIETQFMARYVSSYNKAKIAILGDIFLKDGIYDPRSEINKIIISIKKDGRIKVPGDGTRGVTPVFFDDAVLGILETVFGNVENENIFYIYPKHKINLLTLAHMFQKKNPDLKIDFSSEKTETQEKVTSIASGFFILGENYRIEEIIGKIDFEKITIGKTIDETPTRNKETGKINFSPRYVLLFVILIILTPLITTVLFYFIGGWSMLNLKNSIERGDLSSARNSSDIALKSFTIARQSGSILLLESNLVLQRPRVSGFIQKIDAGKDVSYAASSLIQSASDIKNYFVSGSNSPKSFSDSLASLKNALFIYNKEKQTGLFPSDIVDKLSDTTDFASSTIDFWPDMLGFNGEKTYLILFQNNMELRPGGGFIGSYGILSFNRGMSNFKIYDVYDADGQLKEHIDSPFPIRRYLSSPYWFLRDSNFDVDFSKGAVTAAVFLNKEMKQSVDGVIGVDLSFIKNILTAVGPVKIIDYNQTVDENNFFQVTQDHAEKDFFPGSTQKKDFLKSFYNSLSLKLSENKNIPYLNLIKALTKSLNEKHIVFTFNNINEQTNFSVNGWSSTLGDLRLKTNSVLNDFMGISEANLGGDKANYYITRSVSQTVNINVAGKIEEVLDLSFKNAAPKSLGAQGVYKNYLRFILPIGATISAVRIDGKDQKIITAITDPLIYEKKGFVPPDGVEIYKQDEEQKSIFGFLVNMRPQDLRSIHIQYTLPQQIDLSVSQPTYSLKVFKQPGIDSYPYHLLLNFDPTIKIVTNDKDMNKSGEEVVLSTQITRDREIDVGLTKK